MNKKGYTLVEVIVSIMILSIASIMLAGAFGKVIHFMGKSNAIKNASDDMLAYAEGTNDDGIRDSVTKTDVINQVYKINGTISVRGTVSELKSDESDEIELRQFYTDTANKLKEVPSYKDNLSFGKLLYERTKNKISSSCSEKQCSFFGRNVLLRNIFIDEYKSSYKTFDRSLLPREISIDNQTYYVRVFFPWEASSDRVITSGGPLIYLSKYNKDYINDSVTENLQIVYDYDSEKWYYHNNLIGNKYTLTNNEYYEAGENSNLYVNNNGKLITNWMDFKKHIEDPKNGWRYLDGESIYDSSKSVNEYWLNVK